MTHSLIDGDDSDAFCDWAKGEYRPAAWRTCETDEGGVEFTDETTQMLYGVWKAATQHERLRGLKSAGWRDMMDAPVDGTEFIALLSNGWKVLLSGRFGEGVRYRWWRCTEGVSVPYEKSHTKDTDWSKTVRALLWIKVP